MAPTAVVPEVDLSICSQVEPSLIDATDPAIKQLARDICTAFKKQGVVYLHNHGVDMDKFTKAWEKTDAFFSLDSDVKAPYHITYKKKDYHGYTAMGNETVNPDRPGDLKEVFDVMPRTDREWPDAVVPGFRDAHLEFTAECNALSHRVLTLMAIGLGMEDSQYFSKMHNFDSHENRSQTRFNLYPKLKDRTDIHAGQIRCGEHSDYGSLTLIVQDNIGGLQLKNDEGEYCDVIPVEGTILVNVGDVMQRWSSDLLHSPEHRVVLPEAEIKRGVARRSMACFVNPDDNEVLSCLDGKDTYKPITFSDFLAYKFSIISSY